MSSLTGRTVSCLSIRPLAVSAALTSLSSLACRTVSCLSIRPLAVSATLTSLGTLAGIGLGLNRTGRSLALTTGMICLILSPLLSLALSAGRSLIICGRLLSRSTCICRTRTLRLIGLANSGAMSCRC